MPNSFLASQKNILNRTLLVVYVGGLDMLHGILAESSALSEQDNLISFTLPTALIIPAQHGFPTRLYQLLADYAILERLLEQSRV